MTLAELKKKRDDGELTLAEYRALIKERIKKETKEFVVREGYEPRNDQLPSYENEDGAPPSPPSRRPVKKKKVKTKQEAKMPAKEGGDKSSTPVRPNLLKAIRKGFGEWLTPKKKKIEYKTPPD